MGKEANKVVFDLSNSKVYGHTFDPMCEILIQRKDGFVSMGPNPLPVGKFSNLRRDAGKVFADIDLIDRVAPLAKRIEYSIQGEIHSRNEKDEITSIEIKGIGANMLPTD